MYNIPIDRVCVFNCEAIGVINDAVGGVEVTIENDFTDESGEVLEPEFYKGNDFFKQIKPRCTCSK